MSTGATEKPWRYTLSETTLGTEEAHAASAVVASGWLSMGPRTAEFEAAFAEKIGTRHAIAVANGTAALHLAYIALGIGPGDEVIQPALTFVASANMTVALGATPVFADIVSLRDPTLDPDHVARLITPRTKAIVAMHFGGYPARIAELKGLCDAHGVALLEDACHGPAQPVPDLEGRCLGTFGAMGTFSFFANKNMTTGEGGMVVTDDDALAKSVRLLRAHGMTTVSWDRHRGRASTYDVVAHGLNYRTNELAAAIGIEQLKKLDDANARRRDVAAAYAKAFAEHNQPGVFYVAGEQPRAGAAHIAAVIVPEAERDAIRKALNDARIQTSLHYPPIHHFAAFQERHGTCELPLTEEFARRVITLPIHPKMRFDDAQVIADAIANVRIAEMV